MAPIYFYSHTRGKHNYMSNFYPCNFIDTNEISFHCSEQYLMYQKCLLFDAENDTMLKKILAEKEPAKIKALGRKVKNYNDGVWDEFRYQIMVDGLYLKFSQNPQIGEQLCATYPNMLYEAAPNDNIWGIGMCAKEAITKDESEYGTNLLGKALMNVREQLLTNTNPHI